MPASTLKDYSIPIQMELDKLEDILIMIDGKKMKPSQCYHFSTDPPRVLYNTNCPDDLKQKVDAILVKYKEKSNEPTEELIDIQFDLEGKKYNGWFTAIKKHQSNSAPSSFSVVLNEVFFGHLSFHDCKWSCSEPRPASLITATGRQIELHYKL